MFGATNKGYRLIRVGLSYRIDWLESYGELRDSLDQNWYHLLSSLDCLPVPLPNIDPKLVHEIFEGNTVQAVILTGGNTLVNIDPCDAGASAIRDDFEYSLLRLCIEYDIPVLGVCRGMHLINDHFNGQFQKVPGHIRTRHELQAVKQPFIFPDVVNSYHTYGIPEGGLGENLSALAFDREGNIEAFKHSTHRVYGIMWHPERETPFNEHDLEFIKKALL